MVPSKWTVHILNQVPPQVALSVSIVTMLCTCTSIKFSMWCKGIGHTYRQEKKEKEVEGEEAEFIRNNFK